MFLKPETVYIRRKESHGSLSLKVTIDTVTEIVRSGFEMPSLHIAEPRVIWPSEVFEEAHPIDIEENDDYTMSDNWVYMFDNVRRSVKHFSGWYYGQAKKTLVHSLFNFGYLLVLRGGNDSTRADWGKFPDMRENSVLPKWEQHCFSVLMIKCIP